MKKFLIICLAFKNKALRYTVCYDFKSKILSKYSFLNITFYRVPVCSASVRTSQTNRIPGEGCQFRLEYLDDILL